VGARKGFAEFGGSVVGGANGGLANVKLGFNLPGWRKC
jgi:hypothetical protein